MSAATKDPGTAENASFDEEKSKLDDECEHIGEKITTKQYDPARVWEDGIPVLREGT